MKNDDGNEAARDVWDAQEWAADSSERNGGRRDAILGSLSIVLRYRWWMLVGALLLAGMVVPAKLTSKRTYTSVSQFMPEGRARPSELAGLAAQFGVRVEGSRDTYSPQFYIDLLYSPVILREAVQHRYTIPGANGAGRTLTDHFKIRAETPARSLELAVRALRARLRTNLAVKTNVVELAVTANDPTLAAQINGKLLELLNRFNSETRQSRAAAEREFVEKRKDNVALEVRSAEERLEEFLRRNRQWRNAPELQFEYERRQANVALLRQIQTSLLQSYEQAKIEEIRDIPVLTVVQQPVPPAWGNARGTVRAGILSLLLGGLLGLGVGFLRDELRLRLRSPTPESTQLQELLRETSRDLRTLGLHRLRRRTHAR